jgi:hypothetical protein
MTGCDKILYKTCYTKTCLTDQSGSYGVVSVFKLLCEYDEI